MFRYQSSSQLNRCELSAERNYDTGEHEGGKKSKNDILSLLSDD